MASGDWELHKNTISCLFLLEKLSSQDISVRMKEEYNFDKKKHQYEYQLRKWGIKKNSRREVWRYIGHEVQKRKMLGKMSEITLYGMQLPPDKVRKEVQRYTTIPTARDFAEGVRSPMNPGWDIVRVVTPSPSELQQPWLATLPWLKFLEGFRINLLQVPNMARLLVTARAVSSSQAVAQNPLTIYARISELSRSMPHNRETDDQNVQSSLWAGGPSTIATESLKVILFSLANKNLGDLDVFHFSSIDEKDEFILRLLECISESNLAWSVHRIGTTCPTTNAIAEVAWGCAIRQGRYSLVSQLLEAGLDPNIPTDSFYDYPKSLRFERGRLSLGHWGWVGLRSCAFEIAILRRDKRLGEMLLDAGADTNACGLHLLEWIVLSANEDNALESAQLLVDSGIQSKSLLPLSIAIARHHNRLAKFLIDKLFQMTVSEQVTYNLEASYFFVAKCSRWCSPAFLVLQIDCTLLHIAIVSMNAEMVDTLLSKTLACTDPTYKKVLKDLFMVACFAGDRLTIEQLVLLNVDWSGEDWTEGVSPLVATAWNPDIEIAEMILRSGAFSDRDIGDFPQETTCPLPIHVATHAGNTNFVKWLVGYGRGLDVQFCPPRGSVLRKWHWLIPSDLSTPLQMALQSGNVATVIQCLHAKLLGGELIQAVRLGDQGVLSDLLLRDKKNITFTNAYGDTVLKAAAEVGNRDIISLYFSSGGKYESAALLKAVQAASISRDYSIVSLLATNRPFRIIDRYEASALIIAIRQKQLDLVHVLLEDQFIPSSMPSFYTEADFGLGQFPEENYDTYKDTRREGITPLYAAFASGDISLTKKMLQVGYQARPRDLECCSYSSDQSTASQFLSQFSPISDDQDWTRCLLFLNIHLNMTQRVQECITCIDNLNYYVGSRTPLQDAVSRGDTNLIFLLIDSGADINAPAAANLGATALQIAAINGFISIARSLLERGGNVNAPPARYGGRTALEGASEHGNLDIVQLLLERGAKLDGVMRIHYIRAVAYAKHEGHFALAKLLKEFGGWTDRDQEIFNRKNILDDRAYRFFDENTQDWRFRNVTVYYPNFAVDVDELHSEDVGDSNDELGSIIQEQGNDEGNGMVVIKGEDMGLLMEQYLNDNFEYDWNNLEEGIIGDEANTLYDTAI
ncbi:hypothetical protein NUW58_g1909 [Xylaria curta]|uniref:Uncharacterized protein n=1 Tax=Xylaria curta TaxID=42375 RepID=A0ACC1PKJ6_9PEZI|nr:hypothetical protein NUW58_g1909 [Xylaria curta]